MLCFTSIIYRESSRRLRSFGSHHSENIHQKRCQVPSSKINSGTDFIQATIENASSELSSVFVCALFGRVEF